MIVNLTPHEVKVGKKVFPPSGVVARVENTKIYEAEVEGIEVYRQIKGKAVNLPGPKKDYCPACDHYGGYCGMCSGDHWLHQWPLDIPYESEDIIYIVSRIVKNSVPDRNDVVVPGGLTRDEKGRITGAQWFEL